MRAVIQRVGQASVEIDGEIVGSINKGLLVLIGISNDFEEKKLDWIVNRIVNLRVWGSEEKGFDLNVKQVEGEILVVSQFTLFGDCSEGNKPNFRNSMPSEDAEKIYNKFVDKLKEHDINIQTGTFGAMMNVKLENDGPVTIVLEK